MSFLPRVAAALGLKRESVPNADGMLPGIVPPSRDPYAAGVTTEQAAGLSTVYRALQIISTSAGQIAYQVERNGLRLDDSLVPSLMKRPCLDLNNSEFIEQTVLCMATTGNAYWLTEEAAGAIIGVKLLDPNATRPAKDPKTGRLTFWNGGTEYPASRIKHMHLMKLPGRLTGLGPIQAAKVELRGALELRDYAALWFSEGKIPNGILTSEQVLTADDAKQYRAAWYDTTSAQAAGLKVLGKGTTYQPIMLKPADAQWLESQQFTTTQLARLFGTPASLMLAAVEGSAMTYSNVEQDWIAFVRFTLMGYLRPIENALTDLTVRGQSVRFNFEALLRTDTKTRYEAHALALTNKFKTIDEVRAIEGDAPLTDAQRAEIAALAPAPAPTTGSDA